MDVVIPLAVPNLYTYRVPFEWNQEIAVGKRVVVQFGKTKRYAALIRKIHGQPPKSYAAKYIEGILDEMPVVNEKQFLFWEWVSSYYLCTIGEVMLAALPGGLKLSSETRVLRHPDFSPDQELTDDEHVLLEALELRQVLSLQDVSDILNQKSVYHLIKSMIEKKLILVEEELKEKYKPRVDTYLQLTAFAADETRLSGIFDQLEKKASKQLEVVMAYIKLSGYYSAEKKLVAKADLIKLIPGADAAIRSLVKKNIVELFEVQVDRIRAEAGENKVIDLNELQTEVFHQIRRQFGWEAETTSEKDVVLLHGVTSSGKTEIYIKLIDEVLKQGKQVLYLLPEIALTTQIIFRLRKYFGEKVGVYHSKFNEQERVEVWKSVNRFSADTTTSVQLLVGARSALFLPFSNLGLVIVDEEHDNSFKQFDPAPRYNARDASIFLASLHRSKTLLGSATPCVESYFNASEGKYGFASIQKRFGGIQMPEILIADIKEAAKKKQMHSHFSPLLLDEMKLALANNEQVILFQNRRGFAPQLECDVCAWVPQCTNCDVSLTYHKAGNHLRCHYCGYSISPPTRCGACGDVHLKMKGFGTEKIEEELAIFLPGARIGRMDLDTTRSKFAHQHIIRDFESREIDILVGTQMVTKGLDFDHVSLVGILNADSMLNFPDFRSYERSFQLMAQVAGRAGRKNKRGKVIIQTHQPDHSIIQDVWNNNYLSMYTNQLLDRKNFHYPPYYRLIEISVVHRDIDLVNASAKELATVLKKVFGKRVLGPEFPLISRIRNQYRKNILLKIERDSSMAQAKKQLTKVTDAFRATPEFKTVRLLLDIDPQ